MAEALMFSGNQSSCCTALKEPPSHRTRVSGPTQISIVPPEVEFHRYDWVARIALEASSTIHFCAVCSVGRSAVGACSTKNDAFPETTTALQVLHEFQSRQTEIGIVVDEYGGFEGIVTVADLAMRVLGLDEGEPARVRRENGSWLVDAMMNFADFAEEIGLRADNAAHDTLAGFVLGHLGGRLPRVADHFDASGFRFEIVDMDGRRVDKVLVSKLRDDRANRHPSRL